MTVATSTLPTHDVGDLGLAAEGRRRIEWADREMAVLRSIRERFAREQPLAGRRISACLHVTTETANLMRTLKAGGADVVLCASNPLSTQDDVAAALVAEYGIADVRDQGRGPRHLLRHIYAAVDHRPQITMDDGADVIGVLHARPARADPGDHRRHRGDDDRRHPAQGDGGGRRARLPGRSRSTRRRPKHLFDNRYGTGQSTIDGIIRATNVLLAGRTRGRRLRLVRARARRPRRAAWART